jgi:hypothetical protein
MVKHQCCLSLLSFITFACAFAGFVITVNYYYDTSIINENFHVRTCLVTYTSYKQHDNTCDLYVNLTYSYPINNYRILLLGQDVVYGDCSSYYYYPGTTVGCIVTISAFMPGNHSLSYAKGGLYLSIPIDATWLIYIGALIFAITLVLTIQLTLMVLQRQGRVDIN